jgi:hypothetical protein
MNFRWKYNPTFLRLKYGFKHVLGPVIIFQFVRTIVFPTSFDVIVLGILGLIYASIVLDWF